MTNLAPNRAKAAELIVAGELKKVVAEKVGVSPQTISEWQKQPTFQAYLNQLKLAALEGARDQMQRLAKKAVLTIEDLMGQEEPPSTKDFSGQKLQHLSGGGSGPRMHRTTQLTDGPLHLACAAESVRRRNI